MDPRYSSEDKENKHLGVTSNFIPPPTPLLKKIGFGTGVSVYHLDRSPCNHALRSPWALKKVNREHAKTSKLFQDRLEIEAKILQQLNHPNIVGFRGFSNTEDGRKVLAMEECSESLGNLIEELGENDGVRYDPKKITLVVVAVAKALQYLHEEKGLLHGDLKSYNVLIKGDFEEIKLCDFGVSMELKTADVENYTGTGPWSAPETLDEGPITDKADIFSLGLIIWEMLSLKTPHVNFDNSCSFNAEESMDLEQHYGETPELPQNLTEDYAVLKEIYEWCTRQDYRLRPSARQILDTLRQHGIVTDQPPPQITL